MAEPEKSTEKSSSEDSSAGGCVDWDRNGPHQQEVSRIMADFKFDLMGIIHISEDGVLRSLTADRTVISAQGLSEAPFASYARVRAKAAAPDRIHALELRVPKSHRTVPKGVDGTRTDQSTWFDPDKRTLPPPLSKEHFDQIMNMPEDKKEVIRFRIKERPK